MQKYLARFLLLFFILLKLWIVAGYSIIARYAPQDDLHFVTLALHLTNGEWLGNFNGMTLSKLPGYPLWLALCSELGLTPFLMEQAVYLLAVVIIYCALSCLKISEITMAVFSPIVIFAPEAHPIYHQLLVREFLYSALTLLIFSSWILFLSSKSLRIFGPNTLLLSATLGFYSIVREEFLWIVPLHLVFLFAYYYHSKNKKRCAVLVLLPLLSVMSVLGYLRSQNAKHYGVAVASSQREGNFSKALSAFARIKSDTKLLHVEISKAALSKAYAVSPSAQRLKPHLEHGFGPAWMKNGCLGTNDCKEYRTWSFIWALLEAGNQIGVFRDAQSSEAFFEKLSTEIHTACDAGTIDCHSKRSSFIPHLRFAHFVAIVNDFAIKLLESVHPPTQLYYSLNHSNEVVFETYAALFGRDQLVGIGPRDSAGKLGIQKIYTQLSTVLSIIACVALLLYLLKGGTHHARTASLLILFLLTVGVCARVMLISVTSITGFAADFPSYRYPAFSMISLIYFLSLVYVADFFQASKVKMKRFPTDSWKSLSRNW